MLQKKIFGKKLHMSKYVEVLMTERSLSLPQEAIETGRRGEPHLCDVWNSARAIIHVKDAGILRLP